MTRLFIISLLSLFAFLAVAQPQVEELSRSGPMGTNKERVRIRNTSDENLLNTISITLDKSSNSINFSTPHTIKGVDIVIKQRGEVVVVEESNVTINKSYQVSFPSNAGKNRYTILLQQDNHIVAKRVEKDWM